MNGRNVDASFQLPPGDWVAELDSAQADGRSTWRCAAGGAKAPATDFHLGARSVVLLRDASPS